MNQKETLEGKRLLFVRLKTTMLRLSRSWRNLKKIAKQTFVLHPHTDEITESFTELSKRKHGDQVVACLSFFSTQ